MSRFRRKSRGVVGVAHGSNRWVGFMAIIMGTVAMLICLIMYGIMISNLDTAYTNAATYTEQVGLTDVMGIWPLVLFVLMLTAGLGALGAGSYINVKKAISGSWTDIFLVVIMGTVGLVIAVLMNTVIQAQLHTLVGTINSTTNYASFSGMDSIPTIFGMVIFLALMASGIAQLGGAAYGSYKHLAGKMS